MRNIMIVRVSRALCIGMRVCVCFCARVCTVQVCVCVYARVYKDVWVCVCWGVAIADYRNYTDMCYLVKINTTHVKPYRHMHTFVCVCVCVCVCEDGCIYQCGYERVCV